jgi:hypothetical protein
MLLESFRGELQVWLRPHPNRRSGQEVMITQSLGSPNRDSFGTPLSGKSAIRMQVSRKVIENNIKWKVVASPESGLWWVKWVQGCLWLIPTPKVSRMRTNPLVVGLWMQDRVTKQLVPLPSLIPELAACPSYPSLVLEVGNGTKFQLFRILT